MGAGHDHGPVTTPRSARRVILAMLWPLLISAIVGMVWLWPHGDTPTIPTGEYVSGEVMDVGPCQPEQAQCEQVTAVVTDGEHAGDTATFDMATGPGQPELAEGTAITMAADASTGEGQYGFSDVKRDRPLLLLALLFAVAVVAISRMKGVAAIVGLAVSIGILFVFVLPALLLGENPLAVAAVGAAAIAIPSMCLAHGFNMRTGVAIVGTMVALVITLVLGQIFTTAAAFTGNSSEESWYLQNSGMNLTIDLKGLFVAGLVIGALGVLNDVTITQSAAVWEVRRANRNTTLRDMYTAGMRVGRDHVSATVNTLVLAYIGAGLPLFLILVMSDSALSQTLTTELIASEILRSLVGGIGIIASIPVTTFLAAWALSRSQEELDAGHDDNHVTEREAGFADIRNMVIEDYASPSSAATKPPTPPGAGESVGHTD